MLTEVIAVVVGASFPTLAYLTYFFHEAAVEMSEELSSRPSAEELAEREKEIEELREELRIVTAALKEESQRSECAWLLCAGLITLILTGGLVSLTTATRD